MTEYLPPVPAATLVVFRRARDGGAAELLMIQRSANMRFVPEATVFPGGRIDPADVALAERLTGAGGTGCPDIEDGAARVAAIREALEECGLVIGMDRRVSATEASEARRLLLATGALAPVLEQFGWSLDLASLVPFARWCPKHRRAFDTRFYLADLGTGDVELSADDTETSHLFWSSAARTLDMAREGQARIIFPTRRNLERLAQHASFAAAAAHARAHPVTLITPRVELRDEVQHLTIPEGLGYPITSAPLGDVERGLD